MTDLDMTRLCAEAMGLTTIDAFGHPHVKHDHWPSRDTSCEKTGVGLKAYDPIHDDAQAMALVKNFRLDISGAYGQWIVCKVKGDFDAALAETSSDNLNRAIVECVAKMQLAKKGA